MVGGAQARAPFHLRSADFANGARIPAIHEGNSFGCSGKNIPPRLSWSGAPSRSRSFALTVVDPDAPKSGGFVHWVVYNIPAGRRSLGPASLHGTSQGTNDAGIAGYVGPCPPTGSGPHHYHFTLYALDLLHLGGSHLTYSLLRRAMKNHVLAEAALVGTFQR
jgi:Raf kinase inhibitor-like YbhB/YbcL family protein